MKESTKYKQTHKADFGRERIRVIFMDEWLCVIEKPSGMLSCAYPGSRSRTAQDALESILRSKGELSSRRKPLVVHRLDRDTSGIMMFALTESAQQKIMATWHKMVTGRLYRAVAENPRNKNDFLPDNGIIDEPIALNAHKVGFVPKDASKIKTFSARTHFCVIERGKSHTLFELELDTGRKNQIRAHLAFHGYPIAGDEEHRAKTDFFHRLCLHARTLSFVHPFTGEELSFCEEEPKEWREYVIRGDENAQKAIWAIERKKKQQPLVLGEKRISAKDRAHGKFF